VHHAALAFGRRCGTDKEVFCNLNFRWAEFFADTIPLLSGQDIAALYDDDTSGLNGDEARATR
jgi:hypothetical protein